MGHVTSGVPVKSSIATARDVEIKVDLIPDLMRPSVVVALRFEHTHRELILSIGNIDKGIPDGELQRWNLVALNGSAVVFGDTPVKMSQQVWLDAE